MHEDPAGSSVNAPHKSDLAVSANTGAHEPGGASQSWNHANDPRFVSYYENLSATAKNLERFEAIQKALLRVLGPAKAAQPLDVVDVGCNTGMQCHLWARLGHRVRGLDISEPLLESARRRAEQAGLPIVFELGSATKLPWGDSSVDVCIAPGLLEHVPDWESCLKEFARVLRPGGILYLTTTNVLCPVQEEFNLPLYSWYPPFIKRYCERLATSTRPALANFASYPAIHWFSFYGLKEYLKGLGLSAMDRFDVVDLDDRGAAARLAIKLIRSSGVLRLLAHMTQDATLLVAVKST